MRGPPAGKGSIVVKKSAMPSVGDTAPPIDAATAGGGHFSLAEQAGKWVVIFFYPMANTPG
jgi:thioredoxin-dependent peroxiredoxin